MPLKPHPTDPDKLVYENRRYMFRDWIGLTDEDKAGFWTADQMTQKEWDELFAAIEAKLKEKNCG